MITAACVILSLRVPYDEPQKTPRQPRMVQTFPFLWRQSEGARDSWKSLVTGEPITGSLWVHSSLCSDPCWVKGRDPGSRRGKTGRGAVVVLEGNKKTLTQQHNKWRNRRPESWLYGVTTVVGVWSDLYKPKQGRHTPIQTTQTISCGWSSAGRFFTSCDYTQCLVFTNMRWYPYTIRPLNRCVRPFSVCNQYTRDSG